MTGELLLVHPKLSEQRQYMQYFSPVMLSMASRVMVVIVEIF
jgi:hypothetical protein